MTTDLEQILPPGMIGKDRLTSAEWAECHLALAQHAISFAEPELANIEFEVDEPNWAGEYCRRFNLGVFQYGEGWGPDGHRDRSVEPNLVECRGELPELIQDMREIALDALRMAATLTALQQRQSTS